MPLGAAVPELPIVHEMVTGPIVQFVTTLHHPDGQPSGVSQHQPEHGISHPHGA